MSKRDGQFVRNPRDYYKTPKEAVPALLKHIKLCETYVEPCAGDGQLISFIPNKCLAAFDIEPQSSSYPIKQKNVFTITENYNADYFITNPPWDRKILHPMIDHLRQIAPTWLLFDSDWAYTDQSKKFIPYCESIVAVGRLKWFPGTNSVGFDNCSWYKFVRDQTETKFYGRF